MRVRVRKINKKKVLKRMVPKKRVSRESKGRV